MNDIPRRVWLEISLDTLTQNYHKIADAVAPANVLTVLKANAYGLGVVPIAQALAKAGASGFGVAEPYEALQLLSLGKPVQILSSILPEEIGPMVAAGVILPVTDLATARLISAAAVQQDKTATIHFKLDTGMGRLGILASEAVDVICEACRLPGLDCEGIFSHFPFAYETGSELTNYQMDLFCDILKEVASHGITFAKRHIANSDAINNFPRACRPPFNVVRTGINLHGSFDSAGKRTLHVKPVLTLKTRLPPSARSLPPPASATATPTASPVRPAWARFPQAMRTDCRSRSRTAATCSFTASPALSLAASPWTTPPSRSKAYPTL